MDRCTTYRFNPAISAAMEIVPTPIRDQLRIDWLVGADPIWVGLHDYEQYTDGRSFRATAHVVYPIHQWLLPRARRKTTIVLPVQISVASLVHELGHCLDDALGFRHRAEPTSWYAKTNRNEAFAEAFVTWLIPGYGGSDQGPVDPCTFALFASLAEAE